MLSISELAEPLHLAEGLVVEPSPYSHESLGAWLLITQSSYFSNHGFAFRLAVVKKLKGLPAIKKDSYPALLQVGT